MNQTVALLDVVALLDAVPEKNLVRGEVGTVIEILASDVYEVEFSDQTGRAYANAALNNDQLSVLRYRTSSDVTTTDPTFVDTM